jgi:hypothetical protein
MAEGRDTLGAEPPQCRHPEVAAKGVVEVAGRRAIVRLNLREHQQRGASHRRITLGISDDPGAILRRDQKIREKSKARTPLSHRARRLGG